jgi:hypothetical protein
MLHAAGAFSTLPAGLRTPLLNEYNSILQNFLEQRWTPSELSGGKFCEIVYTILDGFTKKSYATAPAKPRNFLEACRKLESNSGAPRSFQILIPRLLPPLYEIRNNRNVGHVGGDVDPSFMDSSAVLSIASWVMAELVRVLHSVSVGEAQQVVNSLSERRIPLVWESGGIKRVLNPGLSLRDQILVLLASCPGRIEVAQLRDWTEARNLAHFDPNPETCTNRDWSYRRQLRPSKKERGGSTCRKRDIRKNRLLAR